MAYEFRVHPHIYLAGSEMIECWRDGEFVAGIYPHEGGIQIVSRYMTRVDYEEGPPPSAVVLLGR